MHEEILIPISFFFTIFGIVYLYLSTRNKERLALIEKGIDAGIFSRGDKAAPFWKVFILNTALVLMGIGVGIFIAAFLNQSLKMDSDIAYPATIFLMAGIGLFIGFTMTKNLDKE